jgi:hypothetical protein
MPTLFFSIGDQTKQIVISAETYELLREVSDKKGITPSDLGRAVTERYGCSEDALLRYLREA